MKLYFACVYAHACVYIVFFLTFWRVGLLKIDLNRPIIADNRRERVPATACTMGRATSGFSLTFKKLAPPVFNFNYFGEKL